MNERRFARSGNSMQEVASSEGNAPVSVPLEVIELLHKHPIVVNKPTFSERRKSRVSLNSISFTPGSNTIDSIGLLCLESVHRHDP